MATVIQTDNLSNPGQAPVAGDLIRRTYDTGAVEEVTYYDPPPEPPPPRRWINANDFVARFTDPELGQLQTLADSNSAVRGWIWWLDRQVAVDLADARVVDRLQQAVDNGYLTQARMDEILA